MKKSGTSQDASELISEKIAELGDWRGGAPLKDSARLFSSSLDGNVRRAIDIHEGEEVDESALKALVRQAVALNSVVPDAVDRAGQVSGESLRGTTIARRRTSIVGTRVKLVGGHERALASPHSTVNRVTLPLGPFPGGARLLELG